MNSSVRLEALISHESEYCDLERTYSIDTVTYIITRLFCMYADILDIGW